MIKEYFYEFPTELKIKDNSKFIFVQTQSYRLLLTHVLSIFDHFEHPKWGVINTNKLQFIIKHYDQLILKRDQNLLLMTNHSDSNFVWCFCMFHFDKNFIGFETPFV